MKRLIFALLVFVSVASRAGTIGTFHTSVGTWEIEFYDEDRPITVSNFIKYANSGRFLNQFIHRWEPGFVIQGGGYRVDTSDPERYRVMPVQTFRNIPFEGHVRTNYSNVYGTIAMARVGTDTNSASSQWFVNLGDNSGLDTVAGGYTVFGRLISGTNIVNLFVPPPPTFGIYTNRIDIIPGSPVAVLSTTNLSFDDLVYVDLSFRRDLGLEVTRNFRGVRALAWKSIAGVTNVLEYTTNLASAWLPYTNFIGSGQTVQVSETSNDSKRFYRVKALY